MTFLPPLWMLSYCLGLALAFALVGGDSRTIRAAAVLNAVWWPLHLLAVQLGVHINPMINAAVDASGVAVVGIELIIAFFWPASAWAVIKEMGLLQALIVATFALELDFHAIRLVAGDDFPVRYAYWCRLFCVAWVQAALVLGWGMVDGTKSLAGLVARFSRMRDHRAERAPVGGIRGLRAVRLLVDRRDHCDRPPLL